MGQPIDLSTQEGRNQYALSNIEKGNILLAIFMNMLFKNGSYHPSKETQAFTGLISKRVDELQFNSSYEWLMAVVAKIETIEETVKLSHGSQTDYYDFHIMPDAIIVRKQSDEANPLILINCSECKGSIETEAFTFEGKKEALFEAVVRFIEWYNKNNQ